MLQCSKRYFAAILKSQCLQNMLPMNTSSITVSKYADVDKNQLPPSYLFKVWHYMKHRIHRNAQNQSKLCAKAFTAFHQKYNAKQEINNVALIYIYVVYVEVFSITPYPNIYTKPSPSSAPGYWKRAICVNMMMLINIYANRLPLC